jgi:hypothetical protein
MAGDFATAVQTLARADALADLATVLDVAGHSQQAVPVVREAIGQYRRKGNRTSAARARKTLEAWRRRQRLDRSSSQRDRPAPSAREPN